MEKENLTEDQKRENRLRDRKLSDMRHVLKSAEGRRLLFDILDEAKIFHPSYVHGDNGYATTYNTGRQDMGRYVQNWIMEAKPEAYLQMQNEHASELKSIDNERKFEAEQSDILKTGV